MVYIFIFLENELDIIYQMDRFIPTKRDKW